MFRNGGYHIFVLIPFAGSPHTRDAITMNFLILGSGPEERAWASTIVRSTEHHLIMVFPGFADADVTIPPSAQDLDDALATPGVEAAVVGGDPAFRAEALRRIAAEGLPAICLHPPGDDSEAYYQVTMSRDETGAVLVPDLSERLHPGVIALREAIDNSALGEFRSLKYEATIDPGDGDLVRFAFARAVDVVRFLLGEIEAVNATGDPLGDKPEVDLVVQFRGTKSRRAEVRLTSGLRGQKRFIFNGSAGIATLELPLNQNDYARFVIRPLDASETLRAFAPHDEKAAILNVLSESIAGRSVHPDLTDGTRAMEISEAVARSLRRGRTVELHYEEISEDGTFKSVMTSLGCLVLVSILFVLPLALAGPALGIGWTIYLAYLIPPILVGFILMQLFRLVTRGPAASRETTDLVAK